MADATEHALVELAQQLELAGLGVRGGLARAQMLAIGAALGLKIEP